MATTIPSFVHQYNFSNLDTYSYTIGSSATHHLAVKLTDVIPPSGVTITIQRNGTTIATAPQATTEMNVEITLALTAGDVMTFIIASSTFTDSNPNQIKGFINVYQGFN